MRSRFAPPSAGRKAGPVKKGAVQRETQAEEDSGDQGIGSSGISAAWGLRRALSLAFLAYSTRPMTPEIRSPGSSVSTVQSAFNPGRLVME